MIATYGPIMARPNSHLSPRYSPATFAKELLGAQNALFQPNLILAQKGPPLTPCLGRTSAGAKQLTL